MSIEEYPQDKVDSLLSVYTLDKENQVREWFEDVRHELLKWMERHPYKRVHSVRARMKERSHLRDKIERWPKTHNDELTEENFFEKIEDLAGARILVLYRHDVAIVDHFIYRSSVWRVLKAEANYDRNRPQDRDLFQELGFKKRVSDRRLRPKKNAYASIHYILVKKAIIEDAAKSSHRKCELQVRTIHEEAWGEFSHEFTYPPHDQIDSLASNLIRRLSGLLHQAEDIVSDIRRSPADGSLFRNVHQQLWQGAMRRPPQLTFDVIHEMLSEVQFMTRSAPLLAAVGILTEYGGTKNIERGKTINAQEIITLGFGRSKDWSEDELQKLYLQAHIAWLDLDSEHRKIFKFFVWSPRKKGATWIVKVPKLFQLFSDKIDFCLITHDVYEEVHRILEGLNLNLNIGYSLRSIQFILWRTNIITYEFAKLPYRVGASSKKVNGFYSPSPDPDLLTGVLWLPDPDEDEENITKVLHAYADVLMAMKDDTTLVPRLTGDKIQVSGTLTDGSKEMIRNYVTEKFIGLK